MVTTRSQIRAHHSTRLQIMNIAFWLLFTSLTTCMWCEDEGCVSAMGYTGTDPSMISPSFTIRSVKAHGTMPAMTSGHQHGPVGHSNVCKRAYKRACKRALQNGFTWYRGKCLDAHAFPKTLREQYMQTCTPASDQTHSLPSMDHMHAPMKRLKYFEWNASGLSRDKLDELKVWLHHNSFDVAIICETRWSYTNEWTDAAWSYIHTGNPEDKGSGILILIRKDLCSPVNIQWNDIVPGRLLHARLHGSQRPMDILATYQYMDDNSNARRQLRKTYWNRLDETLQLLPNRNVLLLTGDFNCSLTQVQGLVGHDDFSWRQARHQGRQHHDLGEFVSVLKIHGLVALNTWTYHSGPTYVHGLQASRIDFAFTRTSHTDGLAKQPILVTDAPFIGDIEYSHIPLVGSIPFFRIPQRLNRPLGFSQRDRAQCREAWMKADDSWTDMISKSSTAIHDYIEQQHEHDGIIQGLHDVVCPILRDSLAKHKTQTNTLLLPQSQTQCLKNKWEHLKNARTQVASSSKPGLRAWFHCWFHLARHQALARHHKQHATRIRKQKFQDIVSMAASAASQHDSHKLFQIIRKFSPKTPLKRVQIRNHQGAIAHPHEEKAMFSQFITDTWGDEAHAICFPAAAPGIPFSESDLAHALQHVPITKAVAKPCLPGIIIRNLSSQLANFVYSLLCQWWTISPPFVPQEWRDSWLHFLAKPGKQPDRPQNLRAIALQEPIGKCIAGLIAQVALDQSFSHLSRWPQYAYLPHRSTSDAINRVVLHCTDVRNLVQAQRNTVFNRAANDPTHHICGGVQLFLDLTKAFDSVSRPILFKCLPTCGITSAIQSLIMAMHQGTRYHFFHDGQYIPVEVRKGVRQGCKIAPLLWACFMQHFLSRAADTIGAAWICKYVTLYADDLHIGACFHTSMEYQKHVHNIGKILDILQDLGLRINVDKSHALIAIAGTNCRKFQKQVLHHRDASTWIHIPRRHGFTAFRVEQSAVYLGVKLSYRNFEDLTLNMRISAGRTAFRRLRQWLTG